VSDVFADSPAQAPRPPRRWTWLRGAAFVAWSLAVLAGFAALSAHEARPGERGASPRRWPEGTTLSRDASAPTLVVFVHPRCPCTRATVAELERLVTSAAGAGAPPRVLAVAYKPSGAEAGWERTALLERLSAIPGASVAVDEGGLEATRFGVRTSGHVLVYAPDGRLRFTGGITTSRGHEGEGPSWDAARAALLGRVEGTAEAQVFGCGIVSSREGGKS
jgi:hypothetical protein